MYFSTCRFVVVAVGMVLLWGCSSAGHYREKMDRNAYKIIEQKQKEALGKSEPFSVEPPAETLRKRLMLDQNLPYSSPASLNTKEIKPISFWPKDDYLQSKAAVADATISLASGPLKMTLVDALQIAAKNNRTYQNQKESVFTAALNLDLIRYDFRFKFPGGVSGSAGINGNIDKGKSNSSIDGSLDNSVGKKFLNGIQFSAGIVLNLAKILSPNHAFTDGLFGDTSITVPLLRGAGKNIAGESLTQAERDTLYAIYTFERYKRTFAVDTTNSYLSALQAIDDINNSEANYTRSVISTRLIRRLADAGKQKQVDVDQAVQQEYNARSSWISAQFSYQTRLDNVKTQLGIPPDARIELERKELTRLTESAQSIIQDVTAKPEVEVVPPAYAPVTLTPISRKNAGPMELDENQAIRLALENRLDLRTAQGRVEDAQRKVAVAADAFRALLNLGGSVESSKADDDYLNFEKGKYNTLLSFDFPFDQTVNMNRYRQSILSLESAVRTLQNTEDSIKSSIRTQLRNLQQARENLQIQAMAVELNETRVKNMDLTLQAGRAIVRDVLDAQRDLLTAQTGLTNAMVSYRLAELGLQRDLDVLLIDENGIWKEFSPKELNHERKTE